MTESTTKRNDRVPDDLEALQADIEDARVRLEDTVDEIGHRFNVKARMKGGLQNAGHRVSVIGRQRSVLLAGGGVAVAAAAGVSLLAWRRWGR
jgi:hypothetical protein